MHRYEIGIYNRYIRDKVRAGEDVGEKEAAWEEVHYFDIDAESEEHAEKIIRTEYPKSHGFEIDCVNRYIGT
tara:strand:+ start:282 stop:497 length:216 start_codon:yes stop_codon:yes gene_type:complete